MNNSFRRSIASILIAGSIPALVQTAAYAEGEQPAVTSDSADSATLQPSATSSTPVKSSVQANDEPATSTSPAAKGGVVVNTAVDPQTSEKQEKKPEKKAEKVEEPKPSFPIGRKFSRMAQTYTGVNWLTQAISNKVAAHIIKRKVGGSVDVDLKTYSLTDLMAGKVKSATIKLEGAKMMDARLGTIEATTCQPVWYSYSKKKNKSRGVQTPVLISLKATLTQKDVTDALESTKIASTLRGLNLDLPGLGEQQLQIIKPAVEIKDSLVFIKAVLVTKGGSEDTGVPISISAKPILVNQSDIILSELKVESEYITKPEEFAKFFAELINPVVRFSRYDRKNRAFRLVTLDVKDGRIEGKGNLLLAPKQPPPSLAAKH